jgi:DNA-binding LacI/PurR family transcriptional regulator
MAVTRASGLASKYQTSIAYLDASQIDRRNGRTFTAYRQGAQRRCEQLGYSLEVFFIDDWTLPPVVEERTITARGIRGLVILWPHHEELPKGFSRLWKERACVFLAARPSFPPLAVAMSDHFRAASLAVEKAFAAGYRRIGLVVDTDLNQVVENRFTGGFLASHQGLSSSRPLPICYSSFSNKKRFLQWFLKWKPDCIICMEFELLSWLVEAGYRVPEDVSLIHWDVNPDAYETWAGPEQNPHRISGAAIDLVIGQLHRHEFGIPEIQKCTLVEPVWREGSSLKSNSDVPLSAQGKH